MNDLDQRGVESDLRAAASRPSAGRTVALTALAMVAFAANSVLCRLTLSDPLIDAATFTTVRLVSGAATLWVLMRLLTGQAPPVIGRISTAPLMLFTYAICFSFAYLRLSTGTGALILFGAVQVTMMVQGLRSGEQMRLLEWSGFGCAVIGLVVLVLPGLSAPSPLGSLLMFSAGVAWGVYSLAGRKSSDPRKDTAVNFIRAAPLALVVSLLAINRIQVNMVGIAYAVISGAVTSGFGYVIWYAALKGLTATRASIVQLSVPILAALGGVAFLAEAITVRLVVSSVLVLGGILLAVRSHDKK